MKKCFKLMLILSFVAGSGVVWMAAGVHAQSPQVKRGAALGLTFDLNPTAAKSPAENKVDPPNPEERPAEEIYKNIQVLKGLSKGEFDGTMTFMSLSLGVRCNFCHVQIPNSPKLNLESDDKAQKVIARDMIKMVHGLEAGALGYKGAVNCYTCHRGQSKPLSVPTIAKVPPKPEPAATPVKADTSSVTVDQILDRYVEALGGKVALERATSRMFKATRTFNGTGALTMTIYEKIPNKSLTIATTADNTFYSGFNGYINWSANEKGPPDKHRMQMALAKRDAEFYKPLKLKQMFEKLTLIGKEKVGDREVYVIQATPLDPNPEKLYFDAQTGLLVRRYREYRTELGPIPSLTEYEDYREVDGIKVPFLIRYSSNSSIVLLTISEAKMNIAIEDEKFDGPPHPMPPH